MAMYEKNAKSIQFIGFVRRSTVSPEIDRIWKKSQRIPVPVHSRKGTDGGWEMRQ